MRTCTIIFAISILPFLGASQSQSQDLAKVPICAEMIEFGDEQSTDSEYDAALQSYLNALNCDSKLAGQLGPKIAAVFEKIRKQKDTAIRNKSLADRRTKEAQVALALAEQKRKEANSTTLIVKMQQAYGVNPNAAMRYALAAFDTIQSQASSEAVLRIFSDRKIHFYESRGESRHDFAERSPDGQFIILKGTETFGANGDFSGHIAQYFSKEISEENKNFSTETGSKVEVSRCDFVEPGEPIQKLVVGTSLMVASHQYSLSLWRLSDCKLLPMKLDLSCLQRSNNANTITEVLFSKGDEFLLAKTIDGGIMVWEIGELDAGRPRVVLCEPNLIPEKIPNISSISFSQKAPELIIAGRHLHQIAFNKTVLDTLGEAIIQKLDLPCDLDNDDFEIKNILLYPDSDKIVFSRGRYVYAYDWANKKLIDRLLEHDSEIFSLARSPNGQDLLVGGSDGVIKWWEFGNGKLQNPEEKEAFYGHQAVVSSLLFLTSGNGFTSTDVTGMKMSWNLGPFLKQETISHLHKGAITAIELGAGQDELISSSEDGTVLKWSFSKPNQVDTLVRPSYQPKNKDEKESNPEGIIDIELSANGNSFLVLGEDSELKYYQDGDVRGYSKAIANLTQLAMLPDGEVFYTINDKGEAHQWNTGESSPVSRFQKDKMITEIIPSPDGEHLLVSWLTGLDWDKVRTPIAGVWDLSKKKWSFYLYGIGDKGVDDNYGVAGVPYYEAHGDDLDLIRWSPDGKYLFAESGVETLNRGDAIIWDASTGEHIKDMGVDQEGEKWWVYDASQEYGMRSFQKKSFDLVDEAVFSHNSSWLLTYGEKGLEMWDVASGYPIMRRPVDAGKLTTIRFSKDDNYFILGFEDGSIQRWENPFFALKKI